MTMNTDFSWMAWTRPTAIFFVAIFVLLVAMALWQAVSPSQERVGILGIPTHRGDRLFIALLLGAYIHLAWLGLVDLELYWASGLSLFAAALVFAFV